MSTVINKRINTTLSSCLSSLKQVEDLLSKWNKQRSISQEKFDDLYVCCIEAVQNAIIHGNRLDYGKPVFFSLIEKNEFVTIVIEDQGSGFESHQQKNPCSASCIEEENGRGLFFIQQLSDSYHLYDGGRRQELQFRIAPGVSQEGSN